MREFHPDKRHTETGFGADVTKAANEAYNLLCSDREGVDRRWAEQKKADGNAALAKGEAAEAVRLYSLALAKREVPRWFTNRAVAFGHLGNWAEAAEDARRCTQLSEADPKGHFQLARALAMLGDLLPACPPPPFQNPGFF